MPGTDPREAARVIMGELTALPHLPVLPQRVGGDPVGRTAALLVDLHVDLHPAGWRLVPHGGRDEARARQLLASDLDAMEEVATGFEGALKIEVLGPWSLSASIELATGHKALADPGARRDLASSLSEGLAHHLQDIRQRLPGVTHLLVQLDEPHLPAVLAGAIPTPSGWTTLPPQDEQAVMTALAALLEVAGPWSGIWCRHPEVPLSLIRRAGAAFLATEADVASRLPDEDLGEALDAGFGLLLGLAPLPPTSADPRVLGAPARELWRRLGLAMEDLSRLVVVTPASELSGLSPNQAAEILRQAVEVGRSLADPSEP
jgi:hypothetical protein